MHSKLSIGVVSLLLLASLLISQSVCAIGYEQFKANIKLEFSGTFFAKNIDEILNSSIVTVTGDGAGKLLVFTDPICPVCDALDGSLTQLSNVTIYRALIPLDGVHGNSKTISKSILCSENPSLAYAKWLKQKRMGIDGPSNDCNVDFQSTLLAAKSIGFYGTPTIVFSNGLIKQGAASPEYIRLHLD